MYGLVAKKEQQPMHQITHKNIDPANLLLTERQAADSLQLTPRCLQAWRTQRRGPRFVRISARAVRFRLSDLMEWTDQLVVETRQSR